jgi:hypothetical protein
MLSVVCGVPPTAWTAAAPAAERMPVDGAKAAAHSIRNVAGKHITLYTDLPVAPDVDELPAVFDQAVPQWCQYFGVQPAAVAGWHLTGFLMQDKTRFQAAGLLPADLPPFPNGYQRGHSLWLFNQTASYYRRELFLHEGTHAFMNLILGGQGPPWYGEGMAELLGTHRWDGQRLTLRYLPRDKTETEGWGRIKIVRDQVAAKRGLMPANIMEYGPTAHRDNEAYAWCWALCAFLEFHPRYQDRFRQLHQHIGKGDLTRWFQTVLKADWDDLSEEWQLFVLNLEYGYDVPRSAVIRKPGVPLPAAGATVTVAADRGWQSTGIRLEAGAQYQIEATGRYQIAETTAPWWCEPGGVTIHYYQGRPLGQLLGAVRPDVLPKLTPLARPQVIGLQRDWAEPSGGTLYLKINESPADLGDNKGQLTVRIRLKRA